MTFLRWLPTFLAFPLAGLLTIETVGSVDGPVTGAVAGLLAGAVVGAGQWLALRAAGIGRGWIAATAAGMAGGTALAAAVTGAGTETADLVLTGLIAGAAVGAAQSALLGRGRVVAAAWTAVTAASWALGWLVTSMIIVDAERGYVVFGSGGAIVATVLTGLALRAVRAAPAGPVRPAATGA
jgi:hypothetical protein